MVFAVSLRVFVREMNNLNIVKILDY